MRWKILLITKNKKGQYNLDDLYYETRADMRAAANFYKTMANNVVRVDQYDTEKDAL